MQHLIRTFFGTFGGPLLALALAHAVGTVGYRIIGGPQYSLFDCFYMTFITIATVGYGEVVPVAHDPVAIMFTVFIGSVGMGIVYYILAKMTMSLVAGELNTLYRRQKMLKQMSMLKGHYIVCGVGRVGGNVARELQAAGRAFVVIDTDRERIDDWREHAPDTPFLHGDAAQDELLREAGIEAAAGVFAVTGDDAKNLVVTLSAKQLNPAVRVVARCHEVSYIDKIRKVGADDIVSPDFTGGMRIAAAMLRPQVTSFLDEMLRSDEGLRMEEVVVPAGRAGTAVSELAPRDSGYVLMAVRAAGRWMFNPELGYRAAAGDTLIFMATPEGCRTLHERIAPAATV